MKFLAVLFLLASPILAQEPGRAAAEAPRPGDVWDGSKSGIAFRYAPAGVFQMGSPPNEERRLDDETQHSVELTRAFWMSETEITQAQWRAIMDADPSHFADCGDACPVETVNWYDALEFANRLSALDGLEACYVLTDCKGTFGGGCPDRSWMCYEGTYACDRAEWLGPDCSGYRLPTEAEWEYAARAGTTGRYYEEDLDAIAVYGGPGGGNSGGSTNPVGGKKPNAWGLRDILGNVLEWTWDVRVPYGSEPVVDPRGPNLPTSDKSRVIRGGAYPLEPANCRAAYRGGSEPFVRLRMVGVRLVRTAP